MTIEAEGALGTRAAPERMMHWLLLGFAAGFFAVLVFHQGSSLIAYGLGITPNLPYQMRSTQPLGIPQVLSLAFWGGVWAVVFAWIVGVVPQAPRRGLGVVIAGFLFGAFIISTFNWFVLAPLRGQPLGNGFVLANMVRGQIFNGIYGIGVGVWLTVGQRLLAGRL
jgi:hypothetical protein